MTAPKEGPNRPRLYAEDLDGSTVILQLRQNRNYNQRFITMFTQSLEMLASMDRPPTYYRVLMYLQSRLDPQQWRKLGAREISEDCNMSIMSVDRSISMLIADQMIYQKGRTSNRALRLSNALCWSSSAEKHNAVEPDKELVDGRGR